MYKISVKLWDLLQNCLAICSPNVVNYNNTNLFIDNKALCLFPRFSSEVLVGVGLGGRPAFCAFIKTKIVCCSRLKVYLRAYVLTLSSIVFMDYVYVKKLCKSVIMANEEEVPVDPMAD